MALSDYLYIIKKLNFNRVILFNKINEHIIKYCDILLQHRCKISLEKSELFSDHKLTYIQSDPYNL